MASIKLKFALSIIMALGWGKLKTLGLSVLIFAILVAAFDKTEEIKHRFQFNITSTRILGLLIVMFVVSNFKSMPFVWTVSHPFYPLDARHALR